MHRRACAAALLCGPLVAGCGAAARLDFEGHSRPASPVDVSVYLAPGGERPQIDPVRVAPGLVQFAVANQSGRSQAVSIRAPDGRVVARAVVIPAGGNGQLRASLAKGVYQVALGAQPSSSSETSLTATGSRRTGNDELSQP